MSRTRAWRVPAGPVADVEVEQIRYRDVEALVRPTTFEVPELGRPLIMAHQRVVESAMRRGTVLPAPFGVVFRGPDAVLRFIEREYALLIEGLAFLEGHWEIRLHLSASGERAESAAVTDLAMRLYADLRQGARAAVPFPRAEGKVLGAAFLVDRERWLDFMQRAEELGDTCPDLTLDLTGPWPAYDFVRVRI
jgi:hypothetical protein